ncbi:hypothetical protein PWEIH_07746 [Listeria weihenstephanensis FSL R9-0317]|uniref:hypothetical protein n=1 Tax=Listeria weihenstephanensis TaxID=1006155 RepID=UPI0003E87240|nr:hypothetical protein [Listeria weihenstephanensis]EUJ39296.1 hypothetical protein PWEIH_07746 [Listeria weihenstephanensis FSL R9-0317]
MITVSQLFWFVFIALASHVFDFIPKHRGRAWITLIVLGLRIYWSIFLLGIGIQATIILVAFEMLTVFIATIYTAKTKDERKNYKTNAYFLKK